jgi:long-chain fatty acid transport protein
MKSKCCIVLSIALFMMLTLNSFSQNGTKLIGYDAVTSGRGGSATGTFDNPSLIVNNPAGISFLKSTELDVSFSLMTPSVYFKNTLNDTKGKNNLFPLGCISYVKPGHKKIAYGFGIFTQGGMGADFTMNHYLFTDQSGNTIPQTYHSNFAVMQGMGNIAYKISKSLSIGVTAGIVYSQMAFQMPMSMPPSMLRGVINPQSGFTFGDMFSAPPQSGGLGYTELVAAANLKDLSAYEFNGKIGLAYQPSKNFSFGISYTLPVNLNYKKGNAQMDMTAQMNNAFAKVMAGIMQQNPSYTQQQAQQAAMTQFSQLGIDLTKGAIDNYSASATLGLPQSLAAGVSFAATNNLRLSLDAEWVNWANAFDVMNISLSGGTNTNINKMLGTSGTIQMPFPLNWKNSVIIRTGAELAASKKLTLRCGYAYGSNPVQEATVFPVFPAVVIHHVSLGGSLKLANKTFLNAAYEHAFRNDETASQNSMVGIQFNNSKSGLSNNIYHISLSFLLDKK